MTQLQTFRLFVDKKKMKHGLRHLPIVSLLFAAALLGQAASGNPNSTKATPPSGKNNVHCLNAALEHLTVDKYESAKMFLLYHFFDRVLPVKYFKKPELDSYEVSYNQQTHQWVYSKNAQPLKSGEYMMVMDPKGAIYLAPHEPFDGWRNHSSFLRGKPVGAAGNVVIDQHGSISQMDTLTGHYWRGFKNSDQNWKQFITEIKTRGAKTHGVKIISGFDDPVFHISEMRSFIITEP